MGHHRMARRTRKGRSQNAIATLPVGAQRAKRPPLHQRARDFLQYQVMFIIAQTLTVLARPFGKPFIFFLYRKDLSQPLKPFAARVPITVAPARPEEIEEVARIESSDEHLLEQFRDRTRRGQICFVASVGRKRVAYDWACPRPEPIPGGVMSVKSGEAYCTDAFTAVAWRGNNLHPALNYRMLLGLQQAGYRAAYTLVSALNPSSWKVARRVGWELTGVFFFYAGHRSPRPRIWRLRGSLYPCVFPTRQARRAKRAAGTKLEHGPGR
jgi:hypothetical protein